MDSFYLIYKNKRVYEILCLFIKGSGCRLNNLGEKNPRYGKTNTKEHMDAIKNSLIGIPKTDEHKNKISEALKNRIVSEETREKVHIV